MSVSFFRYAASGAALALAVASGTAFAQEARAPEGPIEIVVAAGAGGTPDIILRQAAKIWSEKGLIENPIGVSNRAGGGMTIGMEYVLQHSGADNMVLSLAEPVFSTAIVQGLETYYNRFTPLAVLVQTQLMVIAQPDHKANTLAEMVELARAAPQQIKMSGGNVGSTDDQVTGLIEKATGVDFSFIPHDNGAAALATFLGGNTDMVPVPINEGLPYVQSGKAKVIAMLTAERQTAPELKDIPTAKEQGIDVVWGQVMGMLAPPNLDPAVAKWWEEKIVALSQTDEWKKFVTENYYGTDLVVGERLKGYLDDVHKSRLDVLRLLGVAKL